MLCQVRFGVEKVIHLSFKSCFKYKCYIFQISIRVKSYCRLHLLRAFIFNDECLDILRDSSEFNVIVIWICHELLFSILSVLIYFGTQSDIRVKIYCSLHLLRACIFNFERLDILRDSTKNPSSELLSFEFATRFRLKFRASWYITELNRTFELKVIVLCICSELSFSMTSVLIYYGTHPS